MGQKLKTIFGRLPSDHVLVLKHLMLSHIGLYIFR